MVAVEFTLRVSSMYSIRVPYSYQCARTYPLPAPSTIKGLCANALWMRYGGNPVEHLRQIHHAIVGATTRSDYPIAVSACTVRMIPMNALIRQFAFTPSIACMLLFGEDSGELVDKVIEALSISPTYLGDSESLVTCSTPYRYLEMQKVNAGTVIEVNTLCPFHLIRHETLETEPESKAIVLYMQDDPISAEAELHRYLAPLSQEGDTYYPINTFSFEIEEDCFLIRGKRLTAIFQEPTPSISTDKSNDVGR